MELPPELASAGGHPLPLVRRVDGPVESAGTPGDLLGVMEDLDLDDSVVVVRPGDAPVTSTDGITERRRGRRHFGGEGVGAVLRTTGEAGADPIAARVEEAARAFVEGEADDDMAVLAVRARLPSELAS